MLEALVFHPFWCLGAQRKGMVIAMNETIIDRTYVCLKLIDMLYKKGLINEATYFNVKRTYQNK